MYREFFRLSAKPFQLTPDAAFFFPSSEHRRALAFLEYGLDQADGFIVVTGAVGTGKSTLVQALLRDLDPQQIRVATVVTSQLRQDDMLVWVAAKLGVEVSGLSKALVLRELEKLLIAEHMAGRRVLLIIDEAQNLDPGAVEELRMLSNFHMDGRPLIQTFLVGQNEFRVTLQSPGFEQLRQRVIATCHLNPLNESETRTYIEHRLSQVDWVRDPELTADAFNLIYRSTGGVPRRINNLCDRLLLFAYLEELHRIEGVHVKAVADEIGEEFRGAVAHVSEVDVSEEPRGAGRVGEARTGEAQVDRSRLAMPPAGESLETMARVIFDKANVQQRLAALERGIDNLGRSLKPEIAELKEDLLYVRNLLEDLVTEIRDLRMAQLGNLDKLPRSANQ